VLVATAFVTMGVVVNSRTAFSLFFPSILDEFGWSRGLTAATFTTGLLTSNLFTPFLGVLMDRLGPRIVFPFGLGLMSIGLMLATATREPWHLHLTLGVLVAGASVFVSYMGHSLLLPNWFVRQRGLALGVAFSGVGVGSFLLMPLIQAFLGRVGWRGACWILAAMILLVVLPLNAIVPRRRPEDLGLRPDGDAAPSEAPAPPRSMSPIPPGPPSSGRSRGPSGRAASGRCSSATSPVSSPGTPCRSTRPSTCSSWASPGSWQPTPSASSA
jgi:MFS family permease